MSQRPPSSSNRRAARFAVQGKTTNDLARRILELEDELRSLDIAVTYPDDIIEVRSFVSLFPHVLIFLFPRPGAY